LAQRETVGTKNLDVHLSLQAAGDEADGGGETGGKDEQITHSGMPAGRW